MRDKKLHAVVARSTFGSVKAPHVRSSFEIEMSKRVLWREAHVEVKMHKTPQPRSTFGS